MLEATDLYDRIKDNPPMNRTAFFETLKTRLGEKRADEKVLKRAGNIGTAVHKMVEWTLKKEMGVAPGKQPILEEPEAQAAFAEWVKWRDGVDLAPGYLEMKVYSLRHGYAGTLDLFGYVDGHLAVVDWKTGKGIYPEALLQNAAYREALVELGHDVPELGVIVCLPKEKGDTMKIRKIPLAEGMKHFQRFLDVLRLWKFLTAQKEAA
jgi:hypothetical protein